MIVCKYNLYLVHQYLFNSLILIISYYLSYMFTPCLFYAELYFDIPDFLFSRLRIAAAFLTLFERNFIGSSQRRLGPSFVGLIGLFQPILTV